jgi:hypothetical protein
MDRDVLLMIYGALMGVVSSIITSLVTFIAQQWLERRELERRQSEERRKQMRQIYLPTNEEIEAINAQREDGVGSEVPQRTHEAGSLVLSIISVIACSLLAFQMQSPTLSFAFAALMGFFLTNRVIRFIRR